MAADEADGAVMAVEPYIEPVGLPVLVLARLVVWGAFRGACSAVRILVDRWRNR